MDDQTSPPLTEANLTREAVAVHEAGHAVVALRLGRQIRQVHVEPGGHGRYRGECEVKHVGGIGASDADLAASGTVLLAGWVAGCLAGHRPDPCPDGRYPFAAVRAARDDAYSGLFADLWYFERVMADSRPWDGIFGVRVFPVAWACAREILEHDWDAVRWVAAGLRLRGQLTQPQVIALLNAAKRGRSGDGCGQ